MMVFHKYVSLPEGKWDYDGINYLPTGANCELPYICKSKRIQYQRLIFTNPSRILVCLETVC